MERSDHGRRTAGIWIPLGDQALQSLESVARGFEPNGLHDGNGIYFHAGMCDIYDTFWYWQC